jgi:mannose-6-phosphate isomerase-like protein (cupin superfamily)
MSAAGSGSARPGAAPRPVRPSLAHRLFDIPPQSHFDGDAGPAGELWFVLAGTGRLAAAGHPDLLLNPDQGLWMPPAARYRLSADGPAALRLDCVALPAAAGRYVADSVASAPAGRLAPVTCDPRDCEVETAGDRRFRVLFGPGRGCAVATQFVGEIPPGRAPDHSHPYDEVVLVLEGEGVVHVGSTDHALSQGSCIHLPPGQLHCLENTGPGTMRVLGVFHPADSPAAKLAPAKLAATNMAATNMAATQPSAGPVHT